MCIRDRYTNDIPIHDEAVIATFAGGTVIIGEGNSIKETTEKLQSPTNKVGRIKLNEGKSVLVNFADKKMNYLLIINQQVILHKNCKVPVSYTHLDVYKRQHVQ